jgi:HlyD family secretion protein
MSVVRMKEPDGPQSGGGMDRAVASRKLSPKMKLGLGAGGILILLFAAWFLAPAGNSQTVDATRLTISSVTQSRFDDFLPLRAQVQPSLTVFLDAVEGGRVERVLVEDGTMVTQGQILAELSNSDLQLNVLARQTEVIQQVNSMRSQELALSQTRLANERARIEADLATQTARRNFEMQRPLAERGFVSGRSFADSRDTYEANRRRSEVLRRQQAEDERLQSSQLAQLRASAGALNQSLGIARGTLDSLSLRAPVAGQLTSFDIQVGQSLQRGVRLGQIDSAGRNKLRAQVDEYYLSRVSQGLTADAEVNGRRYRMRVSKIYPQVRNGQFEIDLVFVGDEPRDLQRGQTVQLRMTLGASSQARLVPNGAFYNDTGGNWIFVVAPDGRSAVRRQVRLGRRNADYIEVLDGLEPGERVITSPYTGFLERERLTLGGQ